MERFKSYPPGLRHLKIPLSSRRNALAGLALYAACKPHALWAQRLTWGAIAIVGPRFLPGRAVKWPLLDEELWAHLESCWRRELGPFDSLAGYDRTRHDRRACAVLLLRRGSPVAFVKLHESVDGAPCIEERALLALRGTTFRTFAVPDLLTAGNVSGFRYIATAPLPARIHRPPTAPPIAAITAELSAALASMPSLNGTPPHWRPMHGDFTPWNLRRIGRQTYLVDWEACGWGPPHADAILYRVTDAALRPGHRRDIQPVAIPADQAEAIRFWLRRVEGNEKSNERDNRLGRAMARILRDMESALPRGATDAKVLST